LLGDGCNGIVWRDDAQVVSIHLQKKYSETPMATVVVRELAGDPA
jgi:Holliday junction resolvase RusA-like endonuclease